MRESIKPAGLSLLLAIVALSLAACASGPPKPDIDYKPDYNFSGVQRIAFYAKSGQVSGDNPLQLSDFQRERIDDALAAALRAKGLEVVEKPEDADLLLSWHLLTQHKTDVRTYDVPSGYYGRYNRYSHYSCWACGSHTEVSVSNYTQGTFIVDMIDPQLDKSVWRGVIQSRLKGQRESDQGKYNDAAAAIFATFPPP